MRAFEKGDKVVCVDAVDKLVKGCQYTVNDVSVGYRASPKPTNTIFVNCPGLCAFEARRFRFAGDAMFAVVPSADIVLMDEEGAIEEAKLCAADGIPCTVVRAVTAFAQEVSEVNVG